MARTGKKQLCEQAQVSNEYLCDCLMEWLPDLETDLASQEYYEQAQVAMDLKTVLQAARDEDLLGDLDMEFNGAVSWCFGAFFCVYPESFQIETVCSRNGNKSTWVIANTPKHQMLVCVLDSHLDGIL